MLIKLPQKLQWIPDEGQKLLLNTALFENNKGVSSWNSLSESLSLETSDLATQRLFPLIYENLRKQNVDNATTQKLKIFHRKTFFENQKLIAKTEETLKILSQANIQTIVLKGLALSKLYYRSEALRPMSDIDLLIKKEDFSNAKEVLNKNGWEVTEENLPLHIEIAPSCQFIYQHDNSELDLHWQIMRDCQYANKTDYLWKEAVPIRIGTQKSFTLSPTHQFFHICWHGARYNDVPPIRWIADAVFILRQDENKIDWDSFLKLAELHKVSIPLYIALEYLKENYFSSIPSEAIEKLKNIPTTKFQQRVQSFHMTKTTEWTFRRILKELVFQYQGLSNSTDLKPKYLAYLKYLQYHLGVKSYWQIPSKFMIQAFQHFILKQQKTS